MQDGFRIDGTNFRSTYFRVANRTYFGQTSMGGEATELDIDLDGQADLSFDQTCQFVAQMEHKNIAAIEADRAVDFIWKEKKSTLKPFMHPYR